MQSCKFLLLTVPITFKNCLFVSKESFVSTAVKLQTKNCEAPEVSWQWLSMFYPTVMTPGKVRLQHETTLFCLCALTTDSVGLDNQQITASMKEAVEYTEIQQGSHTYCVKITRKHVIVYLVLSYPVWEGIQRAQHLILFNLHHLLFAILPVFCQTQIL